MSAFALQWLVLALDASIKAVLIALVTAGVLRLSKAVDSNIRHRTWTAVLVGMIFLPVLSRVIPGLTLPLYLPLDRLLLFEEPEVATAAPKPNQGQPPEAAATPEPGQSGERLTANVPLVNGHRYFALNDQFSDPTHIGPESLERNLQPPDVLVAPQVTPIEETNSSAGSQVAKPHRHAVMPLIITAIPALWAVGTAVMLLRLCTGLLIARWMVARSTRIKDLTSASETRECPMINVPLTVGALAPTVLLPPAWRQWSSAKLLAVLAHEQMHIERGDCGTALLAEINHCLYWFHPLAWWLKRELASLAEAACDDAVIHSTGDRTGYARHLLEVAAAASSHRGRLLPLGVSMARKSSVEIRIHSILDFSRPLSQRLSWTRAALLAALMLPLIALAAALQPASGEREPTGDNSAVAEKASQPAEKKAAAPDDTNTADNEPAFVYVGNVVDSGGKPVADAEVRLSWWQKEPPIDQGSPAAITDEQGKFHFTRQKRDFREGDEIGRFEYASIIVTKPGYGMGIAYSRDFETTGGLRSELTEEERERTESRAAKNEATITLVADDLPIEGRIVNTEGQPVTGALVEVTAISEGQTGSLDDWFAFVKKPGGDYWSGNSQLHGLCGGSRVYATRENAALTTKTDEEGRFTIRGLGRERIAGIFVSAPGVETSFIHACSRPGEMLKIPASARDSNTQHAIFYPNQFTHAVGPSQPIEGRVTDKKTGQPLPGMLVKATRIATNPVGGSFEASYIRTVTDADGRYRLSGLPLGEDTVQVLPPEKSRYLLGGFRVTTKASDQPLTRDMEVMEGILVRGRVTDSRTGKPLAQGRIQYFAFNNNPHLKDARGFWQVGGDSHHWTDKEGNYVISVLPGNGILTFMASPHQHYARGAGLEEIDGPKTVSNAIFFHTSPYYVTPSNFHLLKGLNLAPETTELTLDLTLTSGVPFKINLRTADGQPISNYYVFGEETFGGWNGEHSDESFEVKGYMPDEGRRVMVYHPPRNLVGMADVTGPAPKTIDMELRPGGTIRGRVVDSSGAPLDDLSLYAKAIRLYTGKRDQSPATLKDRGEFPALIDRLSIRTDKDGRFEIRGLIPGLKYTAGVTGVDTVNGRRYAAERGLIFTDVTVEADQTKDLGDLIPKQQEEKPADEQKPAEADQASASSNGTFNFAGSVVDSAGKPIVGAKIHLRYDARDLKDIAEPVAETNADGKFQFACQKQDMVERSAEPDTWQAAAITAIADGFGFASSHAILFETSGRFAAELPEDLRKNLTKHLGDKKPILQLPPDEKPIRGRIVTIEGKPVAGARLEILHLFEAPDGHLDDWEKKFSQPRVTSFDAERALTNITNQPHKIVLSAPRTDADGWLAIKGLGRGRVARVQLRGPGIESAIFYVRTSAGQTLQLARNAGRPDDGTETWYPEEFTHAAGPAQPVIGQITDADSDQPLAGFTVQGNLLSAPKGGPSFFLAGKVKTTTDAEGRFRLDGLTPSEKLPRGFSTLLVLPPRGSTYLPGGVPLSTGTSAEPVTQDVKLQRGIIIHGKVVDGKTGKPVRGSIEYRAAESNPALASAGSFKQAHVDMHHYQSGGNGQFEIPVLPGMGFLAFTAGNWPAYPVGVGGEVAKAALKPFAFATTSINLYTKIDLPAGLNESNITLTLGSGAIVKGRVLTPDGQPIAKYFVSGQTGIPSWGQPRGEMFEVSGYFPDIGRRLLFCEPERNLVALHDLKGPAPETLDITLRSGATIKGRLVDRDGLPLASHVIIDKPQTFSSPADYRPNDDPFRGTLVGHWQINPNLTDDQGRFELRGIIPGFKYSAAVMGEGSIGGKTMTTVIGTIFTDVTAQSGETKNLSDVRIKPDGTEEKTTANRVVNPAADVASSPHVPSTDDKADLISLSARVVNDKGQPINGAKLFTPVTSASLVVGHNRLKERGASDAAGKFTVAIPANELPTSGSPLHPLPLIVMTPGQGTKWIDFPSESTSFSQDVVLLPEQAITGRLVNSEGQPVADAKVEVHGLMVSKEGDNLDSFLLAWKQQVDLAPWYAARRARAHFASLDTTTDADGHFTVHGVGPEQICQLEFTAPDLVIPPLWLVNRDGFNAREYYQEPSSNKGVGAHMQLAASGFTHVGVPDFKLTGRVTTDDGQPARGVRVHANSGFHTSVDAETDENGTYRLAGLARKQPLGVYFTARDERNLLPRSTIITAQSDEATKTLDVMLRRGVVVRGRVIDRVSGNGVAGSITFVPLPNNEHTKHSDHDFDGGGGGSDSEGNFKATILPGPGVLMLQIQRGQVEIGGQQRVIYRQADFSPEDAKHVKVTTDGKDRFFTNAKGNIEFLMLAHAVKYVNFAPGSTPPPIEMHIDSGKTVDVEFVDADGLSVRDVFVSGIVESWPMTAKLSDPQATIYALGADRPRHFVAIQKERGLAGAAVLRGDEAAPVRIKMDKAPSLRGRAVDVAGQPLGSIELTMNFANDTARELLRFGALDGTKPTTDNDGRFEIANLPPSESFNIDVNLNGNYLRARLPKEKRTLAPAQQLDLGDVVFGPLKPATDTATAQPEPPLPASKQQAAENAPPLDSPRSDSAMTDDSKPQTPVGRAIGAALDWLDKLPQPRTLKGRVVDANLRPVVGAKLEVPSLKRVPLRWQADSPPRWSSKGITADDGRFTVTMTGQEVNEGWGLAIKHPGCCLTYIDLDEVKGDDLGEIVLAAELPLAGRLIDAEGRPVAGAKVFVEALMAPPKGEKTLDTFFHAWKQESNMAIGMLEHLPALAELLPRSTTDADGRFVIHGLPAERIAVVDFSAPDFAVFFRLMVNRPGFDARPLNDAIPRFRRRFERRLAGPGETLICVPDFKLEGLVTTADGQPVSGVQLRAPLGYYHRNSPTTDGQGRYKIAGLPRGQEELISFTPPGDLLPQTIGVEAKPNEAVKTLDVVLKRGIKLRGRVTDAVTGEGVRGGIRYVPLQDNEYASVPGQNPFERDRTMRHVDEKGNFEFLVIPGPGVVLMQVFNQGPTIGSEQFSIYRTARISPEDEPKIKPRRDDREHFTTAGGSIEFLDQIQNAAKYVNFEADSGPHTLDIKLDRGKTIDVEFVDQESQPVSNAFVSGLTEQWPIAAQLSEARTTIYALGADRPRRLVALVADRGLAGKIELTGDEPSPVRLQLGKAAALRGRAVDEAGQPLAGLEVNVIFQHLSASELYRFHDLQKAQAMTDKDGRFEINNLLPEEDVYITLHSGGKYLRPKPNGKKRLKPGDDRDLGDVVFVSTE